VRSPRWPGGHTGFQDLAEVQVDENQFETGGFLGVFALATGLQRDGNQIEIARNVTVDVTPRLSAASPRSGFGLVIAELKEIRCLAGKTPGKM
jgi:hypothetical protein